MSGTTLTFNDSTTQTTSAVYPPTWLGVGSIAILACTIGAFAMPGDTQSGSYLFRQTAVGTALASAGFLAYGIGNVVNATTAYSMLGGSGSTMSPVGGTWRSLQHARIVQSSYDSYVNYTVMGLILVMRTA